MKRRGNELKILRLFLCAFFIVLTVFGGFTEAFAFNADYLAPEKWRYNDSVTLEDIELSARGNTLSGAFGYCDDGNMCIYTYFSVDEDTLEENRDLVRVVYIFHIGEEEYTVSLDAGGISEGTEYDAFKAYTNFDGAENGVFLSAVQYTGKAKYATVDIEFYVSKKYRVRQNLPLEKKSTTTTKAQKTAKEKTTKAKTTRAEKEKTSRTSKTTEKAKKEKSKAQRTTKFTPRHKYRLSTTKKKSRRSNKKQYSPTTAKSKKKASKTASAAFEPEYRDSIRETSTGGETVMSAHSRRMFIAGIVAAVMGALLFIIAFLSRFFKIERISPDEKDDNENEQ